MAGFATEYSGMRFGFFFFAEYVNVFILSALTVMLFFGGWNAPIDIDPILDCAGHRHAGLAGHRPRRRWAAGCWPSPCSCCPSSCWRSARLRLDAAARWAFVKSLVVGFLLFNVLVVGAVTIWAFFSFDTVMGLVLVHCSRCSRSSFIFVWMRGTLPRVRIDQLMGFAWKWLVAAALLNIFVTAARHPDRHRGAAAAA